MNPPLFDAAHRADLRAMVARQGFPADMVNPIVDVACHAAEEAFNTFQRVLVGSGDPRIHMTAAGIATSLMQTIMDGHLAALRQFAKDNGLRMEKVRVHQGEGSVQ